MAQEIDTIAVDISKQELMSSVLARKGKLTSAEMKSYAAQMEAISKLDHKTSAQQEFLSDGLTTMIKITASTSSKYHQLESAYKTLQERAPQEQKSATSNTYDVIADSIRETPRETIRLNELVRKPEVFDGRKPKPRRWLLDYEDAKELNGWSDRVAARYFSTFLTGTALSWFKTEAKVLGDPSYSTLVHLFKIHYLGKADEEKLSQQVEESRQKPGESIREFMPRYRELLLLLDSKMAETEQMRRIIARLRPEYRPWLAYAEPTSLDELRTCCVKVEAGQIKSDQKDKEPSTSRQEKEKDKAKAKEKSEIRPKKKETFDKKDTTDKQDMDPATRPKPKCYRCTRIGHVSRHCRWPSKPDGTPVNEKPVKTEAKPMNTISEPTEQIITFKHHCKAISVRKANLSEEEEDLIITERRFRNPREQINIVESSGKLISQTIECNGVKCEALVDTGASVSVIDSEIVETNNWKVQNGSTTLVGADGNDFTSKGFILVDLKITIGRTSKMLKQRLIIVKGLTSEVILGLSLMEKLRICIDTVEKRLSFKRDAKRAGIRVLKKEIIPARCQVLIEAEANTVGPVMTLPFHFNNELLIANSLAEVVTNRLPVLVVNSSNKEVSLNEGMQLGTYEQVTSNESVETIASIREIPETSELVNVGDDLDETQIEDLLQLFRDNKEAFSIASSIGETNLAVHEIELEKDAKPFAEPLRRRPQVHIDETRRQIREMREKGIIEESKSPWASAYVLAKKKSGEYRLCIDFRRLNNLTKKWVYPLPNIDGCLESLAGKQYFSQIDFSSGFWQIPMAEKSKELTSFRTEDGQFQFRRMPFGLTNAPATFQKMVNALLTGLTGVNLQVFIDDICIASSTWDEHLSMLDKVFKLIIEANLRLKGSKCTFGAKRVVFLGHEISAQGIRQDPEKLKALLQLPRPRDVAGVKRTLGMFAYYRKFVPQFAMIAEPLTKLTRKKVPFQWEEEQEEAFKKIIHDLGRNAVLAHFSHRDPTVLKTDASRSGVAGLLIQQREGDWKLVACCSRRLSDSEANYGITDLEGLAIVYSVTRFRHFLLGKPFKILVDHCALCVLNSKMANSPRVRRWAILLSEYDFKVEYTKGKLHEDIDCLSRAPVDDPTDIYLENRICTLFLPTNKFEWIRDHDEPESKEILQKAREKREGLRLANDMVYFNNQLYLPLVRRKGAMEKAHLESGHGGLKATEDRLESVWWPSKSHDLKQFVAACGNCQAQKVDRSKSAGDIYHHEVFEPNRQVAIDCLGPVTATLKGNKHIVVAIDSFTKFMEAKAIPDVTANTVAEFISEYCGRHGAPKAILTDTASTFTASMMKELFKVYGIKHLTSAPKHSQGNAVAERAIQSLQEKIALISHDRESLGEWDLVLPAAVLSINLTKHSSTGFSPFEMTYGLRPPLNLDGVEQQATKPHDLHAQLIQRQLEECRVKAIERQADANLASRKYYQSKRKPVSYEIGQSVMIRITDRSRQKFSRRWEGPFIVISREKDIYKLKDPDSGNTRVRHVSSLKPFVREESSSESDSGEFDSQDRSNSALEGREPLNMISTKGSIKIAKFILTMLAIHLVANTSAIIFERTAPIVWTKTDHYVDKGLSKFRVQIKYIDPCSTLRRLSNIVVQVQQAEAHCSRMYNDLIVSVIEDLAKSTQNVGKVYQHPTLNSPSRQKRFVAEFLTGMFFSNILKTVTDKIWPDKSEVELREREKVVQDKVSEMARSLNATELLATAIAEDLQHIHEVVRTYNQKLNMIAISSPEIAVVASYIVAKIMLKSHLFSKLKFAAKNQKVDVQALSELLDSDWLTDVHEGSAVLRSIESPAPGILRMEFAGRRQSKDTFVFRIDSFRYYGNLTGTPALMEYTGERFLVYNISSNCVRAISEPAQLYVSAVCDTQNYEDPRLAQWRKIFETDDLRSQLLNTTMKESYPYCYIYCINQQITIGGQTVRCPPYVFRLDAKISWNTTDYAYTPNVEQFEMIEDFVKIEANVHQVHFRGNEHLNDENIAIERIQELKKELDIARRQGIAINLPLEGGGLSYATATKSLIFLFVTIIILFVYNYVNQRRVDKIRHEKIMRTVTDGIHGDGTYDTIRSRNTATTNVSSSPNVVNINLKEFLGRFGTREDTVG